MQIPAMLGRVGKQCGFVAFALSFAMFVLLVGAGSVQADPPQGEYRILRALYGTPERHVDVTGTLRDLAQRDQRFRLGNDVFGVDPDRGRDKVLRIYAQAPDGRQRTFEYREGSWVDGAQFEGWQEGRWGNRGDDGWAGGWNAGGRGDESRSGYRDGRGGEYRILQALYGTAQRNVDVTAYLRDLAQRDERFRLSNATFGVDPDRGHLKVLRIYAEGPNGPRTFEYTEGSWVDGAQFAGWSGGDWGHGGRRGGWGGGNEYAGYGGGLQILRAEYGTNERRMDITYRLQQRVNQGQLNVKVNNETAGDDPAVRQDKRLWITYSVDGREMTRVVKEGQFLMLP